LEKLVERLGEEIAVRGKDVVLKRVDSPEIAAGLFGMFVLLGCVIVAVSLLVAEGPEVEAVEDQWFNDQAGPFGAVEFRAGLGSICVVLLEVCPFVA
jgi:hypothetical protein